MPAYAKAGADVALLARRVDKLNEVKAEIEKTGRKIIAIGCDVTNEDSVKEDMVKLLTLLLSMQ